MSVLRFSCALIVIFVCATSIVVFPTLAKSDQETAFLAIENAEETLISTYRIVLEVEQAGGNVTGLLSQLNEARELLATALMSFKSEDFESAAHLANLSRDIGEEVKNTAYEYKDLAWNEGMQSMLFTMLGSVLGIVLVVLGSLWSWRILKRRYQ